MRSVIVRNAVRLLVFALVAAHLFLFAFEAVYWSEWDILRHDLGFPGPAHSDVAKVAQNLGLANVFLAAGLVWGLVRGGPASREGRQTLYFFLTCIAVAGFVGYVTMAPTTPWGKAAFLGLQGGLAALTAGALYLSVPEGLMSRLVGYSLRRGV